MIKSIFALCLATVAYASTMTLPSYPLVSQISKQESIQSLPIAGCEKSIPPWYAYVSFTAELIWQSFIVWLPGNQAVDVPTARPQFWAGQNLTWNVLARVGGRPTCCLASRMVSPMPPMPIRRQSRSLQLILLSTWKHETRLSSWTSFLRLTLTISSGNRFLQRSHCGCQNLWGHSRSL